MAPESLEKEKILTVVLREVERCFQCPFVRLGKCGHPQGKNHLTIWSDSIPEFCPLRESGQNQVDDRELNKSSVEEALVLLDTILQRK